MSKLVVLLKRNAALTVGEFQMRWRDIRGPAIIGRRGLLRYVQSHPLPQGYRKGDLVFDGIEEFWFDPANPDSAAIENTIVADDLLDPRRTVAMTVDVHVIKDATVGHPAVKSIELVQRRADMPLRDFTSYWRSFHGPLACHIPGLLRYEQNHLQRSAGPDVPEPIYDGLAVTWFSSTDDMKKAALAPQYRATRDDEDNFLRNRPLPMIITREFVFDARR